MGFVVDLFIFTRYKNRICVSENEINFCIHVGTKERQSSIIFPLVYPSQDKLSVSKIAILKWD